MELSGMLDLETPREKKTEAQKAIEALEAKLNAEKEEHSRTKEFLQHQLEQAEKRNKSIDEELSIAVKHLQRSENAHHHEIIRLEGDVTRGVQDRHKLMLKLEEIHVVEDAVKDLYLHMKERTSQAEFSYEQLNNEREILKGQNVLTVLGALHATLKSLWAFKVDAEAELRGRATNRSQAASEKNRMLEDQMRNLTLAKETAQAELEEAKRQLRAEKDARARTLQECEEEHQRMVEMQSMLTEELKQALAENDSLRSAVSAAMDEGRRRDDLVLKNKELQSARHFDKITSNNKLRQQWHEHLLIVEQLENDVKRRELKLSEKSSVESDLERALEEIQSHKRSVSVQNVRSLEQQVEKLQRVLADRNNRIQFLEKALKKFRGAEALVTTKVHRQYNWGGGQDATEEHEDPGDPNHPMQREIVDIKPMHKEAVSKLNKMKDQLDKPPFVDQLLHDLRLRQASARKSKSMRSRKGSFRQKEESAASKPPKTADSTNPKRATVASDSSMRMRSHGLKQALQPTRPATATPVSGRPKSTK